MSKYTLLFATEENGYEAEIIGKFPTEKAARERARELMREDFLSNAEIDALEDGNGFEGEDAHGYHIVYAIGDEETTPLHLSYIYGLEEDFAEEMEEEDE